MLNYFLSDYRFDLRILLTFAAIIAAAIFAYRFTWNAPFIFDDADAIVNNPTIKGTLPLWTVLNPPRTSGAGGRPVANISFALNYATSGTNPWSYHVTNFMIHIVAAGLVCGFLRRALLFYFSQEDADIIALATTGIWALHPLQTESVTYISQRTECMAGCWYVATFYCFITAVFGSKPHRWSIAAIFCCAAGMMTKELTATAPVAVFLFDIWFISGTAKKAWSAHRLIHIGLACTWLLLCFSIFDLERRSVGFGQGITSGQYAVLETKGILTYICRVIWPHPLIFDYGALRVRQLAPYVWSVLICAMLIGLIGIGIARRNKAAFIGAFFFLLLAPSSSIIPVVQQPIAEHRMYLPSLIIILLVVIWIYRKLGFKSWALFLAIAAACTFITANRNKLYADPAALWADTVEQAPLNPRALTNWGAALASIGESKKAAEAFRRGMRLDPSKYESYMGLGNLFFSDGLYTESINLFEQAVRLAPSRAEPLVNLGNGLLNVGRTAEAIVAYRKALLIKTQAPEIYHSLGCALMVSGDVGGALRAFTTAIQLDSSFQPAKIALTQVQALLTTTAVEVSPGSFPTEIRSSVEGNVIPSKSASTTGQ